MIRIHVVALVCAGIGMAGYAAADNRNEFEKWLKQETQSYQEYRDKRDKEFTGFLKQQWKEMQTFQGLVRDETPKPVVMPIAPPAPPKPVVKVPEPVVPPAPEPKPAPQLKPGQPPQPVVKIPEPVVSPQSVVKVPPIKVEPPPAEIKPAPVVSLPKGTPLNISYFGHSLRFTYDPKFKVRMGYAMNAKAMSDHWSALSLADYESLLNQINDQREPLQLNDWGYALLVNHIAKGIYPGQQNEQSLFTWFMLIKAGYSARIAYEQNRVFLLLPARQQLFAAPYFTFDNVRYYALGFEGNKQKPGKVFTYDGHYPGASKALDMSLKKAVNTGRKEKSRPVAFKFNNRDYRIQLNYDQHAVEFLNTYPQMDIGLYFVADVNHQTGTQLLKQLKPLVEGMSEEEAVNFLLRFVQTAFKYKTDEGQFGTENYLFPEETLHYPYSDCEDRSVFFAWLVRNLVGLEVVGLDFPGHIATAVHFHDQVGGDAINYNNKRYVVADPTYVNANAGMTMPEYKNKRPGVIPVLF
ncbi:MAG: hypothetical protein EP315_04840 [Gammaproteobacteria bacterium]|nr:MAG: hypothetical protein EP315_04840 [Gammaproteobacteria bacterium]